MIFFSVPRRSAEFLWAALLIFSLPVSAQEIAVSSPEDGTRPFHPGEKLTYELRWEFIPAGHATLEVLPMTTVEGTPAFHFTAKAKSNRFVDTFYKVRDHVQGFTDSGMDRSLLYKKKQREGGHKRDIVVNFDWQNRTARYVNFDKAKDPISILPGTFDPISAFYFVRLFDLKEGMVLQRPITDGKKNVIGRVAVVKRETIQVSGREYDTFLLKPELEHVGGVFEKSENAEIRLWVTADSRRLLVRIESEVIVGSFVGDLVSADMGKAPEG
ncbi:MAG: DUF3108 domain-containing protein [Thermodesulfobacteriota bacterium]